MGVNDLDRKWRDATRLGLQSAVAAATQFTLMTLFSLPEQFVGILSAVLVVEPSIGNTLVAAQHRFAATVVGCVIGLLCFAVLPNGYGTAAALAISMLIMNGLAGFKPQWRYGVVAAVALALRAETDAMQTAWDRCIAIGLGVVVGTVCSLVIWPDKAASRAQRHIREALQALADYCSATIEASLSQDETSDMQAAARRYAREISAARDAVEGVRIADDSDLNQQIENAERLHKAVVILERIAGETESVHGDDDYQAEKLDAIRKKSVELLEALADDQAISQQELDDLRLILKELRTHLEEQESQHERQFFQHAMHFGLDEIEDGLAKFAEAATDSHG